MYLLYNYSFVKRIIQFYIIIVHILHHFALENTQCTSPSSFITGVRIVGVLNEKA